MGQQENGELSEPTPINEAVGLLRTVAPARLEQLRARFPEHGGLLDPGIIAGVRSDRDRLVLKIDTCLEVLAIVPQIVAALEGRVLRRRDLSSKAEWVSAIVGLLGNSALVVLFALQYPSFSIYVAAGLALVSSFSTLLIHAMRPSIQAIGELRELDEIRESARWLVADIQAARSVPHGGEVEALIQRTNRISKDVRERRSREGLLPGVDENKTT